MLLQATPRSMQQAVLCPTALLSFAPLAPPAILDLNISGVMNEDVSSIQCFCRHWSVNSQRRSPGRPILSTNYGLSPFLPCESMLADFFLLHTLSFCLRLTLTFLAPKS